MAPELNDAAQGLLGPKNTRTADKIAYELFDWTKPISGRCYTFGTSLQRIPHIDAPPAAFKLLLNRVDEEKEKQRRLLKVCFAGLYAGN